MTRTFFRVLLIAVLSLAFVAPALAGDIKPRTVITDAELVLEEMMAEEDGAIPYDLLKKCAGVIIFPSVVKGGFIIGGSFGRGVVLAKDEKGRWSPPGFVDFGGGSFGFQIGVQSIDLILLVMTKHGLKALLDNNVKLGGDIGVAIGPVGRRASAGTDVELTSVVYSYSRTQGLFAGFSLEGSGIMPNDKYAKEFYAEKWSIEDIIFKRKVTPPPAAKRLMDVLAKYSK